MNSNGLFNQGDIIAPCGDVCNYCPRYIATKSRRAEELVKVAALWKEFGYRDRVVSAQDIACNGCAPDKECTHNIAGCAALKGVNTCGSCTAYPCGKVLKTFRRSAESAKKLKKKCPAGIYENLCKAFFNKKKILDSIHKQLKMEGNHA